MRRIAAFTALVGLMVGWAVFVHQRDTGGAIQARHAIVQVLLAIGDAWND